MTDHARAIEAGARAKSIVTDEMVTAAIAAYKDRRLDTDSFPDVLRCALEAALASGALVPARAVAAERERCAQFIDQRADRLLAKAKRTTSPSEKNCFGRGVELRQVAHALRALSPEPASGEFVVVPRVPTEAMLNAGDMAFCDSYGPSRVERGERIWPVGRLNIAAAWTAMLNAATKDGERK